jgi:NADPH:quinone reductase-like Zn-dependent oxidoreductase
MKFTGAKDGVFGRSEAISESVVCYGHLMVEVHAIPLTEFDAGITYNVSHFGRSHNRKYGIGSGFAGIVKAAGPGCTRFLVGDRVIGVVENPMKHSTLSSQILVPESVCAKFPSKSDMVEVVSCILDVIIAERTLRLVKASDADLVLVTGGTTPLARALIEVAKSSMFGVEWIGTTVGSGDDREYAEACGADETFDSSCHSGDWSTAFESGVNKKEYDIVIDIIGDCKHAKRLLKKGTGRLVSLYDKPTPEEILDFDFRVGGGFISPINKRLLTNSLTRNLIAGCAGRRRKCKGSGYFSVLPTGNGEILDRLLVLLDIGAVTTNVEQVISKEDVPHFVNLLRERPFSYRGRFVVRL